MPDNSWICRDGLEPEEEQTEDDVRTICDEDELRGWLSGLFIKEPRVASLRSPSGSVTFVSISRNAAAIEHYDKPEDSSSVCAMPDTAHATEPQYFVHEGLPAEMPAHFLMPPQLAIDIAVELFRTGELPTFVKWTDRFER